MTDSKLREFERVWKETGSPEDEARYLLELVRHREKLDSAQYARLCDLKPRVAAEYLGWRVETGDLSRAALRLACYCGHVPARQRLGEEAGAERPMGLGSWLAGLAEFGELPLANAVLTLSDELLAAWREGEADASTAAGPEQQIASLRAWTNCPCWRCKWLTQLSVANSREPGGVGRQHAAAAAIRLGVELVWGGDRHEMFGSLLVEALPGDGTQGPAERAQALREQLCHVLVKSALFTS